MEPLRRFIFQKTLKEKFLSSIEQLSVIIRSDIRRWGLDDNERQHILSQATLEDMIIVIMDAQRKYFEKECIKEAEVSTELYDYIKQGGRLA